ncbi:MAG: tRNA glutamyl-Q(34) synthetase GluQRS [Rhodobacteraceae bacterium]|nr:tRNA glutamyl-Q(34) synthetase GluQRS [Paracoccaceae bacterium]
MAEVVERFAPSPNGALHLGHAFSALTAFDATRKAEGRFLVRIEDLDQTRARADHEAAIFEDLGWLGLEWQQPVLRQSERFSAYHEALDSLDKRGLIYPCFCSRRDIEAALSAPQEGDANAGDEGQGPDGPAYPGNCRRMSGVDRGLKHSAKAPFGLRLDMRKAVATLGGAGVVSNLSFKEIGAGPNKERGKIKLDPGFLIQACGDVLMARKDAPASYHLAVVLDDAHQGVTHVTRGEDLFAATQIHRLLQALFGRPTPIYRHHRLIRDEQGRRLAKRDRDAGLAELRACGTAPAEVRAMVGL